MFTDKSVWASRTVWAGIVTILASLVGFLGYTMTAEDQDAIVLLVPQAVTLISGIAAIVGRITATKRIA